jgi:hypothetical protein
MDIQGVARFHGNQRIDAASADTGFWQDFRFPAWPATGLAVSQPMPFEGFRSQRFLPATRVGKA